MLTWYKESDCVQNKSRTYKKYLCSFIRIPND